MFVRIAKYQRIIASFFLVNFLTLCIPVQTKALTSGPSQPETQQFSPAGMDNLVDPFSGDFSYNIPLMDVGGYPININYASGITPDAEASWVGLGWNMNVGAINRSVRGLPDDFSGEQVITNYNVKPNETFGISGNLNLEVEGIKIPNASVGVGLSANLFYNTYNGFGITLGASPSISAGAGSKGKLTAGMGLNFGSEDGVGVNPTLGLSAESEKNGEKSTLNTTVGFPFSSREGLKGMTLSASYSQSTKNTKSVIPSYGPASTISKSSFMGFATPTFSPSLEHNTYNINGSLSFSYSNTDPLAEEPAFGFSGYYSGQFLKSTTRSTPAYGYMYSGLTSSADKMMDFNREKDAGTFNKFTTNLAVTNHTYDIYQVSGQGVGGTYRLYRGDVGSVSDPVCTDQGYSPSLGVEVGVGEPPSTKIGADLTFSYSQTYSGAWPDANSSISNFNSEINTVVNNPATEPVYFKKIGEMVPENDLNFLNNVQVQYNPYRNTVSYPGPYGNLDGDLSGTYDVIQKNASNQNILSTQGISSGNTRQVRNPRTTSFTSLTVNEAKSAAVLPIQNYAANGFTTNGKSDVYSSPEMTDATQGYSYTTIARDAVVQNNQVSEIRVTDQSGSRYVYGIPVYNKVQEEVSFAKESNSSDNASTGLISYTPNSDDSESNTNGYDHYYNKVSTPAYAHSYLLTCVLSSDYVDSDGIKGPSEGDIGTYTKFNYSKVIDTYKWRTPCSASTGVASFSENMHGSSEDDRANYVYGEKEIWYLHSIETRTHVAEFYLKNRLDGLDVADRTGGVGSDNLQYLDQIILYSKADKQFNSNPEPIKTVHFQYDYSLCPGTPNSIAPGGGKLTLRKIWFTYGTSQKGILNPYIFNYADQNFDGVMDAALNPSYEINDYDRWGNYKAANANGLSNAVFPYSEQNKATADQSAAVWALSSIQTPTGGTMRVYYESDDYAYVQNRQAMRMFQIVGSATGLGNVTVPTPGQLPSNSPLFSSSTNYDYMIIDLGAGNGSVTTDPGFKPVTGNPNQEFQNKYLSGIDLTYFKCLIQTVSSSQRQDYVPGYTEINIGGSQLIGSQDANGYYRYAAVQLQEVTATESSSVYVNPIVRAAWMFCRLNLSRQMYGSADATDGGLVQILKAFVSELNGITSFVLGFVNYMQDNNNCASFDTSHSFIRLNEPDKIKEGGGHRVKAVVMVDNWGMMKSQNETGTSSKQTAAYGQLYDYTYQENGVTISAGVAAYEPILGGEENPFRLPVYVTEKVPLAPAKQFFLEEPFGESFFPAPSVGYRQVNVTPLKITDITTFSVSSAIGNGTGTVENEFYTAYDFPTITNRTDLKVARHKPNIIAKFMKLNSQDLVTCSQGYYVELNDMHGKPKAKRVYPEVATANPAASTPISQIEYFYKTNIDGTLNNQVSYVNPDLSISNSTPMGVDVDVVQDQRYDQSSTLGGGLQINVKFVELAVVPLLIPTGFPDFSSESTRMRSVVTTKVVNKYGILQSTTAMDNGSVVTTQNLAWDGQTGEVLLTQVQNEYNDPIYNFTYPGHWAYSRMNFASLNEGAVFTRGGNLSALKDGDELYIQTGLAKDTSGYYITDPTSTNGTIVYKDGSEVTQYNQAKIIRSGSRNMPTTPIGSIVTLDNPIKAGSTTLSFTRVLNAGVNEYQDSWKKFCNCPALPYSNNPIVAGLRGNMRSLRSWSYLTERAQNVVNNNVNIRNGGYFTNFTPFWQYNSTTAGILPASNLASLRWQFVTQTLNYNPMGMEIENQDALLRYSMAQFGYGQNLPVSTSNNSRYQETGFDGFEDYLYGNCYDDHFSWRNYPSLVSTNQAHTGRRSIRISSGAGYKINKVINPCGQ